MIDSSPKKAVTISERAIARSGSGSDSDYLVGLNSEQRDAVETTEGPLLVLAGAGTGKTRVLTTRIAHILNQKLAWASQILAVTFTNRAAREMRERVIGITGIEDGLPWLGTFHSIGAKIVRYHCEAVGLKSGFLILNTDDQIRLLKQLIESEGIDSKRWSARGLASLIDGWKNRALPPEDVKKHDKYGWSFAGGRGGDLYELYQQRLKILNVCDFGDLIMEPLRLWREHPDILSEYRNRFRYILVDEYQDTNVAQYLLLKLLALGGENDRPPNICCVGDDDQSIYGWRGAEVENILRFDSDFLGAKVVRLEKNYRSTRPILECASHLIGHNSDRLGKILRSASDDSDSALVRVTATWDSSEEARGICDVIESFQSRGDSLSGMAILVRASFQMREFEDRFVSLGINYRVIGGPRFYERMEIRDALAYFRIVCQPSDDLAFERIINKPKRGLGSATVRQIHDYARSHSVPMLSAVRSLIETEELKPKQRTTLRNFVADIDCWTKSVDSESHTALAEMVLDESGYTTFWMNDRSIEAPGRLENLKELINSLEEFESLPAFLDHVSLVMDNDSDAGRDAVNLMTLHSAKGLEFDSVFLPGWEEGLFPHQLSLDEDGVRGLEEERRLAHVGITRARSYCHIWFSGNRLVHGRWQTSIPSRFVDELPPDYVEVEGVMSDYGSYARVESPRKRVETATFDIGERVFHIKFGYGLVVEVDNQKLTVDFEHSGEKRVMSDYVESA